MVAGEVYDDPRGRNVAAREDLRDVVMRDERQLHAAPHARLEVAEETVFVDRVQHFGRKTPQGFAFRRLLAEEWDQRACASHRLFAGDLGEIARAFR